MHDLGEQFEQLEEDHRAIAEALVDIFGKLDVLSANVEALARVEASRAVKTLTTDDVEQIKAKAVDKYKREQRNAKRRKPKGRRK